MVRPAEPPPTTTTLWLRAGLTGDCEAVAKVRYAAGARGNWLVSERRAAIAALAAGVARSRLRAIMVVRCVSATRPDGMQVGATQARPNNKLIVEKPEVGPETAALGGSVGFDCVTLWRKGLIWGLQGPVEWTPVRRGPGSETGRDPSSRFVDRVAWRHHRQTSTDFFELTFAGLNRLPVNWMLLSVRRRQY